jgi:polysaccharide export outer membrane protein
VRIFLSASLRLILLGSLAALAAPGCANRVIRAGRMPARYQAAMVTNAKVADLGRLSMPTSSSSLIEPEDVVDVMIASGLEVGGSVPSKPVRVDDNGVAIIALVGPVPLAGLEPFQAEQRIAAAAIERGLYRTPQVTVTMKKKAVNRITVIGAVEKQGVQELPRSQSTLLDALVAAGSLNDKAGTTIEVRRHGAAARQLAAAQATGGEPSAADAAPATGDGDIQLASAVSPIRRLPGPGRQPQRLPMPGQATGSAPETVTIDLTELDPAGGNNMTLQDGDVVRVETRDPTPISVIGLVNKPGQYDMPVNQPVHVLDAIALAGERSNEWADKIYITRHVKDETEPVVIQTSVAEAQHDNAHNIRLAPGDVVSVEKTPQTVLNDVFRTIIRFSFVAGGRVAVF